MARNVLLMLAYVREYAHVCMSNRSGWQGCYVACSWRVRALISPPCIPAYVCVCVCRLLWENCCLLLCGCVCAAGVRTYATPCTDASIRVVSEQGCHVACSQAGTGSHIPSLHPSLCIYAEEFAAACVRMCVCGTVHTYASQMCAIRVVMSDSCVQGCYCSVLPGGCGLSYPLPASQHMGRVIIAGWCAHRRESSIADSPPVRFCFDLPNETAKQQASEQCVARYSTTRKK